MNFPLKLRKAIFHQFQTYYRLNHKTKAKILAVITYLSAKHKKRKKKAMNTLINKTEIGKFKDYQTVSDSNYNHITHIICSLISNIISFWRAGGVTITT